MTTALVAHTQEITTKRRQAIGQAANEAAARHTFADHLEGKSKNTISRKRADLALFETFLNSLTDKEGAALFDPPVTGLFDNPQNWTGITWGIVTTFKKWQVQQGYALQSVNARLTTVRVFAGLATQAGAITVQENALIQTVKGYSQQEAHNKNVERKEAGIQTRRVKRINGNPASQKKAEPVHIPTDAANALKSQSDTPQGRRDTLLMCLMLDHGLRVSEVAILEKQHFDMKSGTLTFYRPKVHKTQSHTLTADTLKAARSYLKHAPDTGIIWRKSHKSKTRLSSQMSETSATRSLTKRVELLGRGAGLSGLSPHDCRHYAATFYARKVNNGKVTFKDFIDLFGWNSPAMALRYIESAQVLDVAAFSD